MCKAKYLCNRSEADNYAMTQIIQGERGVLLGDSGEPGNRNLAGMAQFFPYERLKAMWVNPRGGRVDFVGGREFFVKASQVIVKVTFSI